jgi:hypothetical protein
MHNTAIAEQVPAEPDGEEIPGNDTTDLGDDADQTGPDTDADTDSQG